MSNKRLTATELKALQKQRRTASAQSSQNVDSISQSYSISDTPKSNDSFNISSAGRSNNTHNNNSSLSLHVSDIDLTLNSDLSRLGTSSESLGELNIKSSGSFGNLKLSSESIQQSISEAQGSLSRNGSDLTTGRSTPVQGSFVATRKNNFSESISSESQPLEINSKIFFKTANIKKEETVRSRSIFDLAKTTETVPNNDVVDSPKERSSKRRRIGNNQYEETKYDIKDEFKEDPSQIFKMEVEQPEVVDLDRDIGNNFVCDWSIKNHIKLSSYQTFAWCGLIGSQMESIAATMFVRGISDSSSVDIPRSTLSSTIPIATHIDFDKSLYYFCYPPGPIPEYIQELYYSAVQNEEDERDEIQRAAYQDWVTKKAEWAESFRSLFFLMKSKHCQYFYCLFDSFSVLFLTPGLAGYARHTAIINRSTKRFRRLLEQSDVPFTMPLLKEEDKPKIRTIDKEAIQELKEIETAAPKQIKFIDDLPSTIDNESVSLLLFQGRESVHSLFDFLLNWTAVSSTTQEKGVEVTMRQKFQIPPLYAPSTFLHATLKKAVVKTGQFKRVDDKTGDLEEVNSLELEGPLLPSSVISLFDIFKQSHTEFNATIEAEAQTINFNHNFASNGVSQAASPSSSPRVSGLISMVPSAMSGQPLLGGDIKKVYFNNSTFKIRQ